MKDGEILKAFVKGRDLPREELAAKLNRTRQGLYGLYKSITISPENKKLIEKVLGLQWAEIKAEGLKRVANVSRETPDTMTGCALAAKDAEIIALLKDKVRQMEQEQANLNELHNDLEVMAEFQRAIVELFLAQSQSSGKAAYNKSLEVLRKRGLEGILSREGT